MSVTRISVAQGDANELGFNLNSETMPVIDWQPDWNELDLVIGLAIDDAGGQTLLEPEQIGTQTRDGVRLADVVVRGSQGANRIFAGIGSRVDAADGEDEIFNIDSLGSNRLVGGAGADDFFLRPANDTVISGLLLSDSVVFERNDISGIRAIADGEADRFLIDVSNPLGSSPLQILDVEVGIDAIYVDGLLQQGAWPDVKAVLEQLGVQANAVPILKSQANDLVLTPGRLLELSPDQLADDPDAEPLRLIVLDGPDWISLNAPRDTAGSLIFAVPRDLTPEHLTDLPIKLGLDDQLAVTPLMPRFVLGAPNAAPVFEAVASFPGSFINGVYSFSYPENSTLASAVIGKVSATDADGDPLTYSIASNVKIANPAELNNPQIEAGVVDAYAIDGATGAITLTAAGLAAFTNDFEAGTNAHQITVSVSDGIGPITVTVKLNETDIADTLAPPSTVPSPSDGPPASGPDDSAPAPAPSGELIPATTVPDGAAVVSLTTPDGQTRDILIVPIGGSFSSDQLPRLLASSSVIDASLDSYRNLVSGSLVEIAARSIEFVANLQDSFRSLSVFIPLEAFLDSPVSGRRLVYYSINTAGEVAPLSYNPIQSGGARFYDLDGDGTADSVSLTLVDGGYGDKDGLSNGLITDPSTVGSVQLNPLLQVIGGGTLTVVDPTNRTAPASLALRASLSGRSDSVNQIGYVVLDDSELASADAILGDLPTLRSRARTLFSSLESSDITLPDAIRLQRELLLMNGQSIRFFEVDGSSLDQLSDAADSRLRFLSPAEVSTGDRSLTYSSVSGVSFSLDLLETDQGLNALVGQEQSLAPLLDFTAFSNGQRVRGTLSIGREAQFDSLTGFYRTVDPEGGVRSAGGQILRPGDAGYAEAALLSQNRVDAISGLNIGDDQTSSSGIELREATYLAPFAQVNGDTFFAFAAANRDQLSHFRVLGNNLFGFEDILGGGDNDFDDLVIGFNFSQVV